MVSPTLTSRSARGHLADGLEAALDVALAGRRAGDAEGALAGAEDAVLAELAGLEVEALAHGLVLELQAQGARVGGLVDQLGDGGEERLVDVHDAASSGSRGVARAAGGDVDRLQDLDEVLAGVADARAAAAAGAEHLAELERVDGELVVDALAVAHVLVVARVVAGGVQREASAPGRCPSCAAGCRGRRPPARRRCRSSGRWGRRWCRRRSRCSGSPAARAAGPRSACRSSRGREAASISRLAATRSRAAARSSSASRPSVSASTSRGEARLVGLDQGAPLVGRRLVDVAAVDRREQAVGALDVVRRRADGGAEAAVVDHGAGEVDDRGRLAAAVPELVLVVPVHDLVDDVEGGGVAGLGRQHDARRELGRAPPRPRSSCPSASSGRAPRARAGSSP